MDTATTTKANTMSTAEFTAEYNRRIYAKVSARLGFRPWTARQAGLALADAVELVAAGLAKSEIMAKSTCRGTDTFYRLLA